MNILCRLWAACGIVLALAVFAPAASAAIAPSLTLDQSAGTQAGSLVALTTDVAFSPTSGDTVKDLTEILPPGLLSDASIDGGQCINAAAPSSGLPPAACKIGTGQASVVVNGVLNTTQPLSLYLVKPPSGADLAGVAIYTDNTSTQLGETGEVALRPSGDRAGVGIDIIFKGIPNSISFGGPPVTLSVTDLKTTISAIRMPDSCPSTAAKFTVTADSYADSTVKTTRAPLQVTGCSSLKLTPTFSVTAVRDFLDPGVKVTTDLQQPGTTDQATSRKVVLTLPPLVLAPNVLAVVTAGILCTDPTFASCTPIGSVSSTSPGYPVALQGKAYLTGSLLAPSITLRFPPPFPITLTGSENLVTGSATFTRVPDIPLTDLSVVLNGGPNSVFIATCIPPSGTASTTLTSQNGDQTAKAKAPFTVKNCPLGL